MEQSNMIRIVDSCQIAWNKFLSKYSVEVRLNVKKFFVGFQDLLILVFIVSDGFDKNGSIPFERKRKFLEDLWFFKNSHNWVWVFGAKVKNFLILAIFILDLSKYSYQLMIIFNYILFLIVKKLWISNIIETSLGEQKVVKLNNIVNNVRRLNLFKFIFELTIIRKNQNR